MSETSEREIDLQEFLLLLWRFKWLVMSITLITTAIATVAALLMTPQYQASILVAPVTSNSGAGSRLAELASQLGGLTSLANISLDADLSKSEAIAVLQSMELTEKYVADNNLLPILFSDRWDADRKAWKLNEKVPTLWDANRVFERRIRMVSEDPKSGLVRMTITWSDPKWAAAWANGLVALTNSYLRQRAITESEHHIAYLNEQAAKADVAEIRTAIYQVLESEIKNAMMARGTDEYALRVLDPAVPPEIKSAPSRIRWVAGGFFGGLLIAALMTLIRATWGSGRVY